MQKLFISVLFAVAGMTIMSCQNPQVENRMSPSGARQATDDLPTNVLYVANNNPDDNQAILAFRRHENGTLTPLPGFAFSRFSTGGKGTPNPQQVVGPMDVDFAITTSEDRRFLFATNGGSNTISVFKVWSNGGLTQIPGSPFSSGGLQPTSMYVAGHYLFVVNKNDNPARPNEEYPNYRTFNIESDGKLTPVPDAVFPTIQHSSPSNIFLSPNRKVAFGTDFLAVLNKTGQEGSLRSFTVGDDGKLTAVPGTPIAVEGGGALGVWTHPTQNVVYIGLPVVKKIGVYTYDGTSGKLSLSTSLNAGAAACWLRLNRAGTRMYCLNSAESTISVYDTGGNPASPSSLQTFALKNPGPIYFAGGNPNTTSEPFSEEFSPDEKYLYVVCQHTLKNFSVNYNYLHTLVIGAEGKLSEPSEPVFIPSGAHYRPQGLVIY
jgi:6-phosphogluconolactonase (cycloisomerase 2 family)